MTTLHDSRYSWFRLAVSLALATVGNVGMWVIVVILPAVQAEFQVDRAGASLPYTMTMVGFALGNYLIGRAVDRFGIALSLAIAAVTSALGYLAAASAPAIWVLALVQFVIGFGTAAAFGPLMSDVSHWFVRRRGIAVAIAACGNYLSGAIWPLLLAGVLEDRGWRAVYVVLAVVTIVLVLPLTLLLRRQVPAADAARAEANADANRRATRFTPLQLQVLLSIAGVACCVAMAMPQVHIVALCSDLGYGTAVGAQMLSVMLGCGVISRLCFGLLADRIGGVRTVLISSSGQALALFLYLAFDGPLSLFVVSAIFGLSQGGIVPSYTLIVREFLPAREAGARVGIVVMATIVGMALGGWVSGWIFDLTLSYQLAFLHGIVWNVLNIAIMLYVLNASRSRPLHARHD